jgi:urate oxidase
MDRKGVRSLRCGRRNLRLVKLTGSAFRDFARDDLTTLPERSDRPLFIFLDVYWRYHDMERAIAERSIASEKVGEFVRRVFDDFVSMSIQHLVNEMGTRLLDGYPELSEVSFEAQNRLWDTSSVSADSKVRVFSDPKPAHGVIGLTLKRDA